MKDIDGREIIISSDITKQLEVVQKNLAELNMQVAATEYGRGPVMASVPSVLLERLINAGYQLHEKSNDIYAKKIWEGRVGNIRGALDEQS